MIVIVIVARLICHPQGVVVRLNDIMDDLVVYDGQCDSACVEHVNREDVVISYSDGSVKESGTFESGACHVEGGTMRYSYKE